MSSGAVGRTADRPADRPADTAVAAGWVAVALGAGVVAAGLTGGLSSGASAAIGAAVTRVGMDVAGVLCVGAALLGLLMPRRLAGGNSGPPGGDTGPGGASPGLAGRLGPISDRVLLVAAGVWLGLSGLDLVSRAALIAGRPIGETGTDDLTAFLFGPAAGTGLLVTAVAAAAVLVGAAARTGAPERPIPPPAVLLVVALAGLVGPAATGHAAAAPASAPGGVALATAAVSLHVVAAALWVGGLGAMLLVAGRTELLDAALPRWSRLAGWCLGVVAVSGVVSATTRIGSWAELVTTAYGALVLVKVACLVLAGLLGGAARARLRAGRTPVLRWAGMEILVMAVAVGVAATLTQTA
ncbi:putative copper resistance protein D [Pseudonocardia sediminis]|uniref:Putative copper resistance protein D n=1 Tax=Pseudonocardia sediminis TaxID=1397368 RepID=A0A4Q7USE1_PSEST|nr:CopD family protein [Pseudonocardia sediminis]RZT83884.1 putative copper resistance protein D [Pseudonocardia sediminis]